MRYEYVVNDYYVTHEWRLIEYLLKLKKKKKKKKK